MKRKRYYRNILFPVLLFVLFSFKTVSTPDEINRRMREIEDAAYKDTFPTDRSIKIVLGCYNDSKKIKYKKGIKKSGLFLMVLYINRFEFDNAIKISNEIESAVQESGNYKNIAEYHISTAQCYISIGLLTDAYKEYVKAMNVVEKITNSDDKYYKKSEIYLHIANYHAQTIKADEDSILHYTKEALLAGEKISNNGNLSKKGEKNDWLISLNYMLGNCYLECKSPDINLAKKYFETAKQIYETSKTKMLLGNEIAFLSYLSKFYYNDKNYKDAINFGLKSLELQKKENFPFSKQVAYENIAKSYLELGKEEEYQFYINKFITLSDSINVSEKLTASSSLERIATKKEQDYKRKNNLVLYVSAGTISVIGLCLLLFSRQRNKKIHSNYLTIIEELKNKKDTTTNGESALEKINTFNIPEETYYKILARMDKFEKNLGFLKNDITLSYLSNQFKTNPKSLSSVIKSNTDKNFNTYINDLRINYIIHKLYENKQYREFKINYLAEECGYSSSKVFVTAFKKLTGVTPSYYITNLKKDMS